MTNFVLAVAASSERTHQRKRFDFSGFKIGALVVDVDFWAGYRKLAHLQN
jgi:hypothetical protein